ncbi:MAG: alanine racemase [Candidatus Buchananbacteria bacterium]
MKKILKLSEQKTLNQTQAQVKKILNEKFEVEVGNLNGLVKSFDQDRKKILALCQSNPTPFYLIDQKRLNKSINDFKSAFSQYVPDCKYYYAVKVNHHPIIVKTVIKNNFNLDVSSGRELEIALKNQAKKIVFSGPGKTQKELTLAIKHADRVVVNIDSFREMEKLATLAKKNQKKIRVGVRIFTKSQGAWNKFGIPLSDLKKFWQKASRQTNLSLIGIQFHSSWNKDAKPYQIIIKELATYLKNNFNQKELEKIEFVDFGGGFRPYQSEGYFAKDLAAGEIIQTVAEASSQEPKFINRFFITESVPIKTYAQGIGKAIDQYLRPILKCRYLTEPGRIICNDAIHIVLKVVDVKRKGLAIVDGGINIIGWERFEFDYFPLINLSRPALKEIKFSIFGSLCLPQDTWGDYCYGSDVRENDIILVPHQGALTYSIAQEFIKPIPPTVILK